MMKQGTTNQTINQQLELNVNIKQIIVFQQAFNNYNTLFYGFSQVSGKFPIMLFYSLLVKSNIFSSNYTILVTYSIQAFIKFSNIVLFHSISMKSNIFL